MPSKQLMIPYRAAARRGRGSALSPARREQLWPAVELFESMLRDQKATTHLKICARAAELLTASSPTHHHVVVDEAQDLHPAQWRVLRGAVPPSSDDLFITGDPHQRIYNSKVSLGSLGISLTGRTHRLRLNYRSTEEILSWSAGILSPVASRIWPVTAASPWQAIARSCTDADRTSTGTVRGRRAGRAREGLALPGYPSLGDQCVHPVQRAAGQGVRGGCSGGPGPRQPRTPGGGCAAVHHACHGVQSPSRVR